MFWGLRPPPTKKKKKTRWRVRSAQKIDNDETVIDTGKYLEPLGRFIRHVNNQAHEVPFALTDYYKYSNFPRTIRVWNILPNERRFFEGIYKLPLIYNIIWLLLFIYLFIDRWPICKNDQRNGDKLMGDR